MALANITLSQQTYVESISDLVRKRGHASVTGLARHLGISKPSVCEAIKRLIDLKLAERKSWHEIILTKRGEGIARQLDRRHETLRKFMVDILAMDSGKADELACNMEHVANKEFVDRLIRLAEFLEGECLDHSESMCRYIKS